MFKVLRVTSMASAAILFLSTSFVATAHPHTEKASWGYKGKESVSHWGDLDKSFDLCKSGKQQSPIDIKHTKMNSTHKVQLQFNYHLTKVEERYQHDSLELDYVRPADVEDLILNGETYRLEAQHFHKPAEHLINGQRFPMEIHFVHKNSKDELAVVGVLVKEGDIPHKGFQILLERFGNKKRTQDEVIAYNVKVNPAWFLPDQYAYYHYTGSLTTPPCTENVKWFVMETPIEISHAQKQQLDRLLPNISARPTQKLTKREMHKGHLLAPLLNHAETFKINRS